MKYRNNKEVQIRKRTYVATALFCAVMLVLAGRTVARHNHVDFVFKLDEATVKKAYAEQIVTPTPTPTEHELIIAYIKQVFGKEADHAFTVLSCENHALNPLATGHNSNLTTDTGIFQINSIWANPVLLQDWKFNIDTAYKIFQRGGWNEWACEYVYHVLDK